MPNKTKPRQLPSLKTKSTLGRVVEGHEEGRVVGDLEADTSAVDEVLPDGVAPFRLALEF